MTEALAWSINAYFEELGRRLGFQRVSQYEHMMGLGEKAGWNIPGESPGVYPDEPGDGGVAKLCSFGEGIHITPLQLASIVMTIANGGTMYYLQHPLNQEQARNFVPRIKRHLDIAALTPEVKDGMLAAVQYGTARRAHLADVSILGKTGTCSRDGTRFGLFASYLGLTHPRMVVVVILRGNRSVYGPRAAEIAGDIYKALDHAQYFALNHGQQRTTALPAMALPVPGAN
jgi:cell division protein FtsI/penicillin-binding protein 2